MLNILEAVLRGLSSGVRDSEITVRMILVSSAMQGPAIFSVLSPGQTIATLLGATCWLRLATPLRRVETCGNVLGVVGSNLKKVKFFMQHLQMLHDVVVVWPGPYNNSVAPKHSH